LIFIEKGGEIRLYETLATNPEYSGQRCQNLIPSNSGDDKNKHGNHEDISSDPKQPYDAAHAYGHALVNIFLG